jgi:hypothetical protein
LQLAFVEKREVFFFQTGNRFAFAILGDDAELNEPRRGMDDGWLLTCSGIRRCRDGLLRGDGNGRKDQEKRKSKSLQPNDHDNFSDPGTNQHSTLDPTAVDLRRRTFIVQDFSRQCGGKQWLESWNSVTGDSFEFAARGGLVQADMAVGDLGLEVVFAFYGGTGEAAEHGDLTDVGQGVSDGTLEEAIG